MRADLLEAQACVDWAVSKLPGFRSDFDSWLSANMKVTVVELPPPATSDHLVASKKEPFPLAFNVEFGAYLNALRSSLDILAVSLARRHNIVDPEESWFPVAKSMSHFTSRDYKGHKFVNGLPQTERTLIESLKPYHGGNNLLWVLHQLDIKRKHHRLLEIVLYPTGFSVPPDFPGYPAFTPEFGGWVVSTNDKTVLGSFRKGTTHNWSTDDLKLTQSVAVNEPTLIQPVPVIETLHDLAGLAQSIIKLFDF